VPGAAAERRPGSPKDPLGRGARGRVALRAGTGRPDPGQASRAQGRGICGARSRFSTRRLAVLTNVRLLPGPLPACTARHSFLTPPKTPFGLPSPVRDRAVRGGRGAEGPSGDQGGRGPARRSQHGSAWEADTLPAELLPLGRRRNGSVRPRGYHQRAVGCSGGGRSGHIIRSFEA